MTYQEAISILRQHNIWRRYNGPIADTPEMINPTLLGEAIDVVCGYELTWEDMRSVVEIADEMLTGTAWDAINWPEPKKYYEEVLRRFNMRKNH